MPWSADQRSIVRDSLLAVGVCAAVLAAGYAWLPAGWFGLGASFAIADRLAFALQADLVIFLWLAGCVRAVSKARFHSPADIRGSASGPPSPALKVRMAVLQNSLEQTVLAVGAHLILATVLHGTALRVIPLLVGLYLLGRITFAWGYARSRVGRAFGMAVTGVSTVVGYGLALGLLVAGRAGP